MSRRQAGPPRALSAEERTALLRLSRSRRAPAAQLARARRCWRSPKGKATRRPRSLRAATPAIPLRAGWRGSTAKGWRRWWRTMVGAIRSATARSSGGGSWPRLPALRTGRGMARRHGVRGGTCKLLTLFQPATGQVHVQPATRCTNPILHGWLKQTLALLLTALPRSALGSSRPRAWTNSPRPSHGTASVGIVDVVTAATDTHSAAPPPVASLRYAVVKDIPRNGTFRGKWPTS